MSSLLSSKNVTQAQNKVAIPYAWQMELWQHYQDIRNTDRLPHAILLHGLSGLGKFNFAKALAHFLLCDSPENQRACGQCRHCQLQINMSHPDLLYIEPDEQGKQIKVDQIRAVIEFVAKTPQLGSEKVVIVAPAENLNLASANAFLKCLEEPASLTTILLVSHSPTDLLPTVRSRCQSTLFYPPVNDAVLPWLQQAVEGEDCVELLKVAENRPLTALELYRSGAWQLRKALASSLVDLRANKCSVVDVAKDWIKEDSRWVFFWLLCWLTDMQRWFPCRDSERVSEKLRSIEMLDFYASVMSQADYVGLFTLTDQMMITCQQLSGSSNANKQLAYEHILILWLEWAGFES